MDERIKVFRAHLGVSVNAKDGHSTFAHYGYLSPCGQWVEAGDTRWRRTDDWCVSEAEAMAKLAPTLAAMGAKLIEQANELIRLAGNQQ